MSKRQTKNSKSFARINEFGFIESPYRKVTDGRVVEYVKVINGGGTGLKPHSHIPLEDVEAANKKLKKFCANQ